MNFSGCSSNSSGVKRSEETADLEYKNKSDNSLWDELQMMNHMYPVNPFENGAVAERIIAASDTTGVLSFIIKFKNIEHPLLVPAYIANTNIPQMVIQFYEKRVSWNSMSDE
ncbi:heterochromatin protein 1-like [Teleopsis dalmanni]|nr:heterochromatin protein 1-like [Teleopsis dalmanni]